MRSFMSLCGLKTGGIPGLSGLRKQTLIPGLGSPKSGGGQFFILSKLLNTTVTPTAFGNQFGMVSGDGSGASRGSSGYGPVKGGGSQSHYVPSNTSGGGGG